MAVANPHLLSEDDLKAELEYLRHGLLPLFLIGGFIVGWAWFPYIMFNSWELGINTAPTVALLTGTAAAYGLREKRYDLACWVFILSTIVAISLITAGHPLSDAMSFGVLVIIAANALLGTRAALATALLMWFSGTMARATGLGIPWHGAPRMTDMFVLYMLTVGTVWLAARPLRASVESALSGWTQARDALLETRGRRAELYRALRALEEATYRIERMNDELIVARREAELARALKARLAATVSHELRGPLNLVLGFSRMIALSPEKYGEPLPAAYHADIDAIYRNSQHLVALVDDILDLSQIEAERLPLVKDRVMIEEDVITKAMEIVRPLAERKGIGLRQEIDGPLPWILADPVRLRQVLLNLLNNAVRFTERGVVTVRARHQDTRILVSVQDTGMGIAAEDIPQLFEAFRQVHTTERREERGSGLGLSICKQLIELHGGEIWVESQPGLGTTFHFTLPLPGTEAMRAELVHTEEVPHRPTTHKNCLIVHDNPSIVRLLARHIEGYRVIGLPDAKELLAMVEELHPRAVITTHALAPQIEAQLACTPYDVPVIGCALPSIAELGRITGVIGYLVKPILPEMLAAIMRQVEREGETTVVLVDDDPDAVRLLELMLTALPRPYRIIKAYDGLQALERMQNIMPDIVFLDLVMPGLDGQQTIERMRAIDHLKKVPVVIISARDWFEDRVTLGMPITISARRPLEATTSARCFQSLLDVISPCYLPDPTPPAPLATDLAR